MLEENPGVLGLGPRVAVVGAGAFGGWTALHLQRLGARVTLFDAWGPGNPRASSGGESRVLRAVYGPDGIYVAMVRRALPQWIELGHTPSEPLYVETGALWLLGEDDRYVRAAAPLLAEFGFALRELTVAETAQRFPAIALDGVRAVYLEEEAGILHARRACLAVRDALLRAGGTYARAEIDPAREIDADVAVFACGPWLGKALPGGAGGRGPAHAPGGPVLRNPRHLRRPLRPRQPPCLARLRQAHLLRHARPGDRLQARRRHARRALRPHRGGPHSQRGSDRARARLPGHPLPELARAPILRAEVCQYENSPDGHLVLDRHPERDNVWLLGGGSGHGFKLAPALGELAAEAILSDREVPALFRLDRLKDGERTTQFQRKS
jgi:glycine/D-amino acid oxidase-like deaminating enzyme